MQRDGQAAAVRREEQKEVVQEDYLKWTAQKLHQVQLSRLPVCCTTLHGLYCAVPHCIDSTVLKQFNRSLGVCDVAHLTNKYITTSQNIH